MRDRYRLGGVGNEELVAALSTLVQRENDALSDLLAHLAELDERRLYLDLGFTSLFAYCTEALGFCRSSAGRRIAVARVCRKYPEAFARVARGELQLSVLSLLGPHLNPENAAELFEACVRKSCEQVELLLAARFPRPDVREAIRRLPTRADVRAPDGGCGGDAAPAPAGAADPPKWRQMEGETECDTSPARGGDAGNSQHARERAPVRRAIPAQRGLEPLSADRFAVRFTADAEFRELLEEVRALASHREPGGDLMSLMKRGLEAYRRELQKKRFGVGRKPRRVRTPSADGANRSNKAENADTVKSAQEAGPAQDAEPARGAQHATRSRHVPAAVAREVYLRDGGCCTFCAEDGRHCGARRFLELDHVTPWAARGETTVENLRLRCRAHNQQAARSYFGAELVQAAVASRRRRNGSATD